MNKPDVVQGGQAEAIGDELVDGALVWIDDGACEPARVTDLGDSWQLMPTLPDEKGAYLTTGENIAIIHDWLKTFPATAGVFAVVDNGDREPGMILPKIDRLNEFLDKRLKPLAGVALRPQLIDAGDIPVDMYLATIEANTFPVSGKSTHFTHDIIDHAIGAASVHHGELEVFHALCHDAGAALRLDAAVGEEYLAVLGSAFDSASGSLLPIDDDGPVELLNNVMRYAENSFINNDRQAPFDTSDEVLEKICAVLTQYGIQVCLQRPIQVIRGVQGREEHFQKVFGLLQ